MNAPGEFSAARPDFAPVASSPPAPHLPRTQARLEDADESLRCFFQPIVCATSGSTIFAHECLTRFRDSRNLEVSIQTLFESAGTRQLKRMLHSYALRETLAQATRRIQKGRLFININPQLFYEDQWHWQEVEQLLTAAEAQPSQIVWEITESDRLEEAEEISIVRFARESRALGSQIALDDWGLQTRSLDLLERVRPEFLKLEKELVSGCYRDSYRGTMVTSLLQMCRQLEVKSIVEGVETVGDWNWIRKQAADYAQGYYLGRPQPQPQQILRPAATVLGHHFELNVTSVGVLS